MRARRVLSLRPSCSAALLCPLTFQPQDSSTARMCARSTSWRRAAGRLSVRAEGAIPGSAPCSESGASNPGASLKAAVSICSIVPAETIAAFRMEDEFIDSLKRIYSHAKRHAKLLLPPVVAAKEA